MYILALLELMKARPREYGATANADRKKLRVSRAGWVKKFLLRKNAQIPTATPKMAVPNPMPTAE